MDEDMKDVYTCMTMLKLCETKWLLVGRYWDLLCEIITVNQLSAPAAIDASEEAIASWGNQGGTASGDNPGGFAGISRVAVAGTVGGHPNNVDTYEYVLPEELLADKSMDTTNLAYFQSDLSPGEPSGAAKGSSVFTTNSLQSLFDNGVPLWTNWTRLLTGRDDTPPLPGSIP
ncbi:hypothetical protein PUNSTDRAFT_132117 [Punctularia strigosozonata HHB-11173 SS5]|uniref:uncharacterized protein n=1 Tax=Punctularia strigosozonata (strain HHB-11173) TaxID=741275 RepID=UPI0004418270|nr:uncharacterized protein PUNSTDRAFT_132117 [Punctularia strigosozonata HHB-11173 SS5]EIN11978.1 hypothetical protein PUNSTDRAFT_132117 [Punctularia strigosozonata HHB-11173 SS5]